jgi:hypothetical protein
MLRLSEAIVAFLWQPFPSAIPYVRLVLAPHEQQKRRTGGRRRRRGEHP